MWFHIPVARSKVAAQMHFLDVSTPHTATVRMNNTSFTQMPMPVAWCTEFLRYTHTIHTVASFCVRRKMRVFK